MTKTTSVTSVVHRCNFLLVTNKVLFLWNEGIISVRRHSRQLVLYTVYVKLAVLFRSSKVYSFRKVDQKYLESFAMRCYRRIQKISKSDRVQNEELLQAVKE